MNSDNTLAALFEIQAEYEAPRSATTALQFVDRVRAILDKADDAEPVRCAWCLADAIEDSEMGTTAGNGGVAVVIANGHSLCLEHFRASRTGATGSAGTPALEPIRDNHKAPIA